MKSGTFSKTFKKLVNFDTFSKLRVREIRLETRSLWLKSGWLGDIHLPSLKMPVKASHATHATSTLEQFFSSSSLIAKCCAGDEGVYPH